MLVILRHAWHAQMYYVVAYDQSHLSILVLLWIFRILAHHLDWHHLIETLLNTWSVIFLWSMLQKLIPSLGLEQKFISLLIQMEKIYSYLFIYYHLPTTDVWLFSTQKYHKLYIPHNIIKGFNVKMVLNNHNIIIPINRQEAKLTIIYNYYVTSAQKKRHGPLRSGIPFIGLIILYFFGNLRTDIDIILT